MKKLYFMRHGQSELNVQGRFAGHTETPLTDEGRSQAIKAGRAAKGLNIDLIVASPLTRAHETARLFAKEIGYHIKKILTHPILIERFYGELEGKPFTPDLDLDGIIDAETDDMLVLRAHEALAWINSLDAENILVISHGSFGRALRSILKEEYPMSHPERLNNAELVCWVED